MAYRRSRPSDRGSSNQNGHTIRGPVSALTGYLAANNISATTIRDTAAARRAAAEAANNAVAAQSQTPDSAPASRSSSRKRSRGSEEDEDDDDEDEPVATKKPRSGKGKITPRGKKGKDDKNEKAMQKKKQGLDMSSDDDEDLDLGSALRRPIRKLPGQLANCETCDKRFTVTSYTKAGPKGGLLCKDCAMTLDFKEKPVKQAKQRQPRGQRQKQEASALDNIHVTGVKSLATMCLDTILANASHIEDLGEIGDDLKAKVNKIMSKARTVNSQTLDLFLRDNPKRLVLNDCAYLTTDDLLKVFMLCPNLESLTLRNANQFKGEVVKYIIERGIQLEEFHIHGANLVTADEWDALFATFGSRLRKLKLSHADQNMTSAVLQKMCIVCPSLEHLSLRVLFGSLDNDVLESIKTLGELKKLSLEFTQEYQPEAVHVCNLIGNIGKNLDKLSLKTLRWAGNEVLDAIHSHCSQLSHLTITDSEVMTDAAFADLFEHWNNPALEHINFSKCRFVDSNQPTENPDSIGFCDAGFGAMWKHSSAALKTLCLRACRHISVASFHDALQPGKTECGNLGKMDVGFTKFDQHSLYRLFVCAQSLKQVWVFGIMDIKNPRIPRGVKVFGIVGDKVEVFGTESMSELIKAVKLDDDLSDDSVAVESEGEEPADAL